MDAERPTSDDHEPTKPRPPASKPRGVPPPKHDDDPPPRTEVAEDDGPPRPQWKTVTDPPRV